MNNCRKNPSNLLPPVRTSSLWGTSLIASNVTIRATSCYNVIRHQSKFNAAFEWETTAALHADSCSLMAWLEKWISLICLIAYVTCRQFGLSVQGWESANLGLNLFQKANEKAVTAFFCLFFGQSCLNHLSRQGAISPWSYHFVNMEINQQLFDGSLKDSVRNRDSTVILSSSFL